MLQMFFSIIELQLPDNSYRQKRSQMNHQSRLAIQQSNFEILTSQDSASKSQNIPSKITADSKFDYFQVTVLLIPLDSLRKCKQSKLEKKNHRMPTRLPEGNRLSYGYLSIRWIQDYRNPNPRIAIMTVIV